MIPFQYLAFEVLQRANVSSVTFPQTGRRYIGLNSVIELTDNISYGVSSYAPSVSTFTGNTLTTPSEYPRVEDTITVNVFGQTAAACMANLEALIAILDQANRWSEGDSILAVQITAQTQCGTVRTTAMVYGGSGPTAALAPELEVPTDPSSRWVLRDVTLTIIRQGRWMDELVDDSDDRTLAGIFASSPVQMTFTNTQSSIPAPTLFATNIAATNLSSTKPGFVIVSPDLYTTGPSVGKGLRIADASTLTATNWTTVNDAANFPYQGTNILRLTRPSAADTAFWPTAFLPFVSTTSIDSTTGRLWAFFVGVRNNSAAVPWFVRVAYSTQTSGVPTPVLNFQTRPVLVDGSITTPQVIALGVVPMTNRTAGTPAIRIEVAAGTTTGAATFDLSYIACVSVDNTATTITQFVTSGSVEIINNEYGNAQLSGVAASIGAGQIGSDVSNRRFQAFNGDSGIETIADRAYVQLLFPGTNEWQPRGGAGAANVTYNMRRRLAYRSPQ